MSKSKKVLLALAVLVSLLLIGLGIYQKQDMFFFLGVLILSLLIIMGSLVFLMRILRKLSPRTIAIVIISIFLVLVVLIIISPEIPMLIGIAATVAPTVIYMIAHRARDVEGEEGCSIVVLTTAGGLILLALLWLFQRDFFLEVMSNIVN